MRFATLVALGCLFSYGLVADTTQPSAPKKSTAHPAPRTARKKPKTAAKSPSHAKTTAKGGSTSAKRRKSATAKNAKSVKTAPTWRSRQLAPTPDRYKEIQSALAQRGYLKKDATGVWDGESADAMRRFQQDQNLEPSGKVNSLSLIALGMGAKHGNPPPPTPAPAPQTVAPQAQP